MSVRFDIAKEPFVAWPRLSGNSERVGLLSLIENSAEFAPFSDAGSQTTFAVIRVLLVLMHQTRPTSDEAEWQKLWDAGRFPADWLAEIDAKTGGKFDLFHQKRPFFQRVGDKASDDLKDKPVSYLQPHFAAATGINFASHTFDDRVALCPACCACGLLELPPFCGAGGSGLMASVNSTPPVYFLPVGRSLFRTLLLNWPVAGRVPGDRPQWEPGKLPEHIGLLEGFTWEPREVRLLPDDGGVCANCGRVALTLVRRIVFRKGVPASRERLQSWRDPHVSYKQVTVGKKTQTRSLVPPEPDKRPAAALGFWRDVVAELVRGSSCRAVERALGRCATGFLDVACVVPFTRPGQDKKHIVLREMWSVPPLTDGQRQQLLAELAWLDSLLSDWSYRADAEENQLPSIASLAEFERRAEESFRDLLDRKGEKPEVWHEAIRTELRRHTQPVALPGHALETARVRRAIDEAFGELFRFERKAVTV